MFRSLKSVQSPVNLSRKGNRKHRGATINFYDSLDGLIATDYGTYIPSNSENLTHPSNIFSVISDGYNVGIMTVQEDSSSNTNGSSAPYQLGIDWTTTDVYPDHLYDNYILTIERKTLDQVRTTDLAVSSNVAQGPNTSSTYLWSPFDYRDGAETFTSSDDNKFIHGFTNPDLIQKGFLYYCVIKYPSGWDPSSNYYGVYGLDAFDKIDKSYLWEMTDSYTESDEDFYVRIRGIKENTGYNNQGNIFQTDSSKSFEDFLDNESQLKVANESAVVGETIFRIESNTGNIAISSYQSNLTYTGGPETRGITTCHTGIIGFGPNMNLETPADYDRSGISTYVPSSFEDSFDLTLSGSSDGNWDHPELIWSPIVNNTFSGSYYSNSPSGGVIANDTKYWGISSEVVGVNAPIGPFCSYYTSLTFITVYKKEELSAVGMTTGSSIEFIKYNLMKQSSVSRELSHAFLSVVNLHKSFNDTEDRAVTQYPFSDLTFRAWSQHHNPGTYSNHVLGATLFYDSFFSEFLTTGIKIFNTNHDLEQDNDAPGLYNNYYIWNGIDDIAVISSWDYTRGYTSESNPLAPAPYYAGGEASYFTSYPLVQMAKTYANVSAASAIIGDQSMGGSVAYAFPTNYSYDEPYFRLDSFNRSFNQSVRTDYNGISYPYETSYVSHNSTNTTYGDLCAAGGNHKFSISARPLIELGWTNTDNIFSKLTFKFTGYAPSSGTPCIVKVWLDTGKSFTVGSGVNNYYDGLIGPLTLKYTDANGDVQEVTELTVYETEISLEADLSDYINTGTIRPLFTFEHPSGTHDYLYGAKIVDLELIAPLDFVSRKQHLSQSAFTNGSQIGVPNYVPWVAGSKNIEDPTFNTFILHADYTIATNYSGLYSMRGNNKTWVEMQTNSSIGFGAISQYGMGYGYSYEGFYVSSSGTTNWPVNIVKVMTTDAVFYI